MKLSTRARYALRMTVDLARSCSDNEPVSLSEVSNRTDISRGYLEQLALTLRNAKILRSVPGRRGGYLLARPASQITVGEIVEASIGPISIVGCVESPEICNRTDGCECRTLYEMVNDCVTNVLHSYTVADLLDPSWGDRLKGRPASGGKPPQSTTPQTDEGTD